MGRPSVSTVVVEAGPHTVRGPRQPPDDWVAVAITCVDDELGLLDDAPVPIGDLWQDVLAAAIGDHDGPVALVLPTWWPRARFAAVSEAMRRCRPESAVYRRSALLSAGTDAAVVEVADDFVVVTAENSEPLVLRREALDLTAHVGAAREVLIDVPGGVAPLTVDTVAALRATGVHVGHAGRQQLSRGLPAPAGQSGPPPRSGRRLGAAVAAATVAAAAGWLVDAPSSAPDDDSVVVVEGRAAVRVPAQWTTERITTGPGSARLQVSDPSGTAAVHLTQSRLAVPASLPDLAETLRAAIAAETPGVFVDFDPDGRVGGRAAVTYREVRSHSHIRWSVVVDGSTGIAVGCQSVRSDADSMAEICTRAVESAHEVN